MALSVMGANALWSPAQSIAKGATAPAATPAPPPPTASPAPAPARHASAPRTHAAAEAPRGDRCTAARQAVERAGDHLGAGYEFRCPATDFPRWGATSVAPCGPCWVDINTGLIGSDATLRYVIAHEFCHSNGVRDEQAADDCAARYGFPNAYFAR